MQDDPDDPGERLSDFEEDGERTMNEHMTPWLMPKRKLRTVL